MATNPAVSLPDSKKVRDALAKCEFLVVSDCMRNTDTTVHADVLLPATTWGEREGTVTSSERRISRQRAFRSAPGEARHDWQIINDVASRMGFAESFDYSSPRDIFVEYASLTGTDNAGSRDLDISALAHLDEASYEEMKPVQWPVTMNKPQGTERMFADGRYYTPSQRARFIPIEPRQPQNLVSEQYPLVLNTGRLRDQWHTMTRTGKSAKLSSHQPEASLQIHPQDAARYQIGAHDLVKVTSDWGTAILRARISEEVAPGSVFAPIHWNDQYASQSVIDAVINNERDPVSGQPGFKYTPVCIEPWQQSWYGFVLSRRRLTMPGEDYWCLNQGKNLYRYEIAGAQVPEDWSQHARGLLCANDKTVSWMEYFDNSACSYRAARFVENQLESCIFIGAHSELPARDWLMSLFDKTELSNQEKTFLLSGRPASAEDDIGEVVCACFGVGRNVLLRAIQEDGLNSVEAIGQKLQAGTNCGSCIPELKALLAEKGS